MDEQPLLTGDGSRFDAEQPLNYEEALLAVLVVDTSGSMTNDIGQVNDGLVRLKADVQKDRV